MPIADFLGARGIQYLSLRVPTLLRFATLGESETSPGPRFFSHLRAKSRSRTGPFFAADWALVFLGCSSRDRPDVNGHMSFMLR